MRYLIPLVAWLCASSACSLLFGGPGDEQGGNDAGGAIDGSVSTGEDAAGKLDGAGAPDAGPIDAGMVEQVTILNTVTGDFQGTMNPSLQGPIGVGNSALRQLAVFVVTQGVPPTSVVANGISMGAPLIAVAGDNPTIHLYVASPPNGAYTINVSFPNEQHSTVAAALVGGVSEIATAQLNPGSAGNPIPNLIGSIENNQLLLYSVACSGAATWGSNNLNRKWQNGVGSVFSATGLMALTGDPINPTLTGGNCLSTQAAGAIFSAAAP